MDSYYDLAFRLFNPYTSYFMKYYPELKTDLKRANIQHSLGEYISFSLMTSVVVFVMQLPIISFFFGLVFQSFLFSFISAVTLSFGLSTLIFLIIMRYPKSVIKSKASQIDANLPFATLYLSTVAGSKLPLHRILDIFGRFTASGEMGRQVQQINEDIKFFGIDVNTALDRAIERSPSKNLKELLYGIMSTVRSGADLSIYLKEKSNTFMADYRRKLFEFSHSLTLYIEIYLTLIILGTVFFTILTSIISGIGGTSGNIIFIQFFIVFALTPVISVLFIFLVKTLTPGGE